MIADVEIWTDGACSGNPGKGGWGAVLKYGKAEKELSGGDENTTNNKMELTAVIEALKALKRRCDVLIYTDSKYVLDGVTKWLPNWKQNGWKTANKRGEVKNIELWQELDALLATQNVRFKWVKGHSGIDGNERVDALAREKTK